MRRHISYFLATGILLVLLATHGWALTCGDTTGALPPGAKEVLRISGTDNAHAEMPDETAPAYSRVVYCQEGGVTFSIGHSLGANTIIQLSGNTNAHAEQPGGTFYSNIVSLIPSGAGSITISVTAPNAACPAGSTPVLRMSGLSNAHVQSAYNNVNPAYPITICATYDPSGGGGLSQEDIVALQPLFGSGFPVAEDATATIDITTQNLVSGNSEYTSTVLYQVSAICDKANAAAPNGQQCDEIDQYAEFELEIAALSIAQPSVVNNAFTIVANKYDDTPSTPGSTSLYDTYPANNTLPSIQGSPNATYQYTVNPTAMGLPPGDYRFLTIQFAANYDRTTIANNLLELPAFTPNNFQWVDFTIDPPGGGGSSPTGSGGDVFILKSIDFSPNPPLDGSDFSVNITAQYKGSGPITGDLDIIIRDGKGNPIAGSPYFAQGIPINFTGPGEITHTEPIDYAGALDNLDIEPGQTYTLYATIRPYVETPVVGEDDSETVKGNNSAFKTFAVLQPQETVNVPDAPPWMSVFMALVVLGWLFVSSRKEDKE